MMYYYRTHYILLLIEMHCKYKLNINCAEVYV